MWVNTCSCSERAARLYTDVIASEHHMLAALNLDRIRLDSFKYEIIEKLTIIRLGFGFISF